MTDNEIIKALECCVNADCENCPSKTICDSDTERFVVKVFDLINRQKAEIEEYRNTVERVLKEVQEAKALWVKDIEKARADAVKEFAERLMEKCDAPHWCVWLSEIEDLVKEFTEGKEND